jgi:hypothetical protein
LAYRGGKAVANVPPDFSAFRPTESSRSAGQILAHIGDLLDWALRLTRGEHTYKEIAPQSWDEDVARFFASLQALDAALASDDELGSPIEKIFQGPIADALTHVGQIALMRRLASTPIRGENYFVAEIVKGRVGKEQSGKRVEFD